MDNNSIAEKIKACDDQYLGLFCSKGREWGLFVYQDRQLSELPAHNFLRIPDHIPVGRLRGLADVARNTAKATGRSVLRIELSQPLKFTNAASEHWGCYYLTDPDLIEHTPADDLILMPVDDEEKVKRLIEFEAANGKEPELDRRQVERLSSVYLADKGLTCWLCCRGDDILGRGELFINGDAAGLYNLKSISGGDSDTILTALRQQMIEQGIKQGAEFIYAKSETDLAGFTKISDVYAVEWRF